MVFGFKNVFLKAFATLRKENLLPAYLICVTIFSSLFGNIVFPNLLLILSNLLILYFTD